MKTKFEEKIAETVDFKIMRGKFLAEKLLRTWTEDFVDEDTGDCVTIDRHELILDKGTEIGETELGVINFHLQSEGISKVLISDQKRTGTLVRRSSAVWVVTANYGNKKYNLYLYSDSLENSMLIATDYLEQIVSGLFSIVGVKELDYSVLIPENFEENEENENFDADYYKIEVCILEDDTERDGTFIVKASDAEIAKEIIIRFLTMKKLEDNNNEEMTVTIISAKTIPCNYVIEYEFSLEYLNNENES